MTPMFLFLRSPGVKFHEYQTLPLFVDVFSSRQFETSIVTVPQVPRGRESPLLTGEDGAGPLSPYSPFQILLGSRNVS